MKSIPVWLNRLIHPLREVARWLKPGLGIKRWFFYILAGLTLLSLGLGLFILDLYRSVDVDPALLDFIDIVALRILPRPLRILIFGGLGVGLVVYGIIRLNRSILTPFLRPGESVIDQLSGYRRRERGPRIVSIGGGHGQATLLRGIKEYSHNITAVVTVADDGGSSGELRRQLGILPPGDIRNCLAALSNDEALLAQLFQYRFSEDVGIGSGHSFGNLFIYALSELTGSFEEAVAESGRVLAVHGRVLPATLHDVRLVADVQIPHLAHEVRVMGESSIPSVPGRVRRVWLEPNNPPAFPPVIQAVLSADMIVIGPGSLYTSILPDLLVPDLAHAIRASRAYRVYVCNVATQRGETSAYTVSDHVRAIEDHVGRDLIDVVVCNRKFDLPLPPDVDWVRLDDGLDNIGIYAADLVDEQYPWRHDARKLARVLMDLYLERTGPLESRN